MAGVWKPVEFVHLFISIVCVLAENQMTHLSGWKFLKSDHKHMSRAKGHWGKTQHEDSEPWTLSWLLFSLLWQKRKAVCLEGLLSSSRDVMAAGLRQPVTVHTRSGKRVVRDGAQCPSPYQSGTPACGKMPSAYQVSLLRGSFSENTPQTHPQVYSLGGGDDNEALRHRSPYLKGRGKGGRLYPKPSKNPRYERGLPGHGRNMVETW